MMKQLVTFTFILFSFINGFSQSSGIYIDSREYEVMKQNHSLPKSGVLKNPQSFTPSLEDFKKLGSTHQMRGNGTLPTPRSASGCSCYIPPDGTYTLAMGPNDDGSTNLLTIPFNFCLYGTNYSSLYINNNGNVSFVNSYFTFSSSPFPDPSYIMVAPFWGDVDTRGAGTVQYKITPTAMYVNWVGVGYFNTMFDMVNTFQLIITDGNDPILPPGNNIAFCYGDMQWTTGSASSGVNGFGGIPATVGINKGDGVSYVQMGRFDQPGIAYDGGYGANDGVDWLDNKSFFFNSCSSTNLPPIASGINNCDTIRICGTGDSVIITGLFLAPEITQNTTISVNTNGTPDVNVISNVSGNSATAQVMIVGSSANAGNNIITFTATDDGSPVGITTINVNVFVDIASATTFFPLLSGNLLFCAGDSSLLDVTPTTYSSYMWNTGATTTSIYAHTSGQYWVTTTFNGCYKTNFANVTAQPLPIASITGNTGMCFGGSNTLSASGGGTYLWWNTSDTSSTMTVTPTVTSTYIVEVKSSIGCTDTAHATVVISPAPIADFDPDGACLNQPVNFTDLTIFPSGSITAWSWDFGDGSSLMLIQNPSHLYTSIGTYPVKLIVTSNNGCMDTITKNVVVHPLPQAQFASGYGCKGSIVPFTDLSISTGTDPVLVWSWNFGDGSLSNNNQNTSHQYVDTGSYTVHLLVISNFGCRDSITKIVKINPPLVVNFTASDTVGCNPLCVNFQSLFTIAAGSHASCLWDFGDGSALDLSDNPNHCYTNTSSSLSAAFNVTLTVTPDTGCVTSFSKINYINVYPIPIAGFSVQPPDVTITEDVSTQLGATGGGTYSWSPETGLSCIDCVNPIASPLITTDYCVMVTDTNNCSDIACLKVTLDYQCPTNDNFIVPNAFSPNNDGHNDLLVLHKWENCLVEFNFLIFDRWGEKVFESKNPAKGWDGRYNGKLMDPAVYIYFLNATNIRGEKITKKGNISLIR